MSAHALRRGFAGAQARVQARYGDLPTEADWRRISGARGLGSWLEEARGGRLKAWVKGFSAASDVHDIELGVRGLLLDEIDSVAGFVPARWRDAVAWTQWLPLLGLFEHLRAGGELPRWARRMVLIHDLLDDDGSWLPQCLDRAGLAPLLTADDGRPVAALWLGGWRERWPSPGASVRADLERLARRLGEHLLVFRRGPSERAWTLRQQLREQLRFDFHRLGLSPAMPFVYLALVALDLERLRRALLDRSLFADASQTDARPARKDAA